MDNRPFFKSVKASKENINFYFLGEYALSILEDAAVIGGQQRGKSAGKAKTA